MRLFKGQPSKHKTFVWHLYSVDVGPTLYKFYTNVLCLLRGPHDPYLPSFAVVFNNNYNLYIGPYFVDSMCSNKCESTWSRKGQYGCKRLEDFYRCVDKCTNQLKVSDGPSLVQSWSKLLDLTQFWVNQMILFPKNGLSLLRCNHLSKPMMMTRKITLNKRWRNVGSMIVTLYYPSKHKTFCITFVQRRPNVFDVGPIL